MTGLDTETYSGKAVLIATPRIYRLSPQSFEECVEFLLSVGDEKMICWNADYDISAMLKFLPRGMLRHIYQSGQWQFENPVSTRAGFIRIQYVPRKFLRVWAGERKVT